MYSEGVQIHVDRERCQGHGKCYLSVPELFEPHDDDEWGRVRITRPGFGLDDTRTRTLAERAIAGCPERALSITG